MGSAVSAPESGETLELVFLVVGTRALTAVDVVRSDMPVQRVDPEGRVSLAESLELGDLEPGDFVYLRVEQEDGGLAWSSPFFVER